MKRGRLGGWGASAVAAAVLVLLVAAGPVIDGLERSRDSLAQAELACDHLVPADSADSPARHQCLQEELEKPDFRAKEFIPAAVAVLAAFGVMVWLNRSSAKRARLSKPRV